MSNPSATQNPLTATATATATTGCDGKKAEAQPEREEREEREEWEEDNVDPAELMQRLAGDERERMRRAGKTPTLSRRWVPKLNRYQVVLKVDKWRAGLLLLAEAPLVYTGPPRQVARIPTPKDDQKVGAASAANNQGQASDAKDGNKKSAKSDKSDKDETDGVGVGVGVGVEDGVGVEAARWARCEEGRRLGGSEGALLLAELGRERGDVGQALDELVESYGWCNLQPPVSRTSDAKVVEAALERTSTCIRHVFSRTTVAGRGLYPFLQHVHRAVESAVNAVVWHEESVAHIFPLKDLRRGDEIVLPVATHVSDQRGELGRCLGWAAAAATSAIPASVSQNLVERVAAALISLVEGGRCGAAVDLAKLQLLLIDLAVSTQHQNPPPTHVAKSGRVVPLWRAMFERWGLDPSRAPAAKGSERLISELPAMDRVVCDMATRVAHRRLGILELLGALRNDADAIRWRQLWFDPPHNLADRLAKALNLLSKPHGPLLEKNS